MSQIRMPYKPVNSNQQQSARMRDDPERMRDTLNSQTASRPSTNLQRYFENPQSRYPNSQNYENNRYANRHSSFHRNHYQNHNHKIWIDHLGQNLEAQWGLNQLLHYPKQDCLLFINETFGDTTFENSNNAWIYKYNLKTRQFEDFMHFPSSRRYEHFRAASFQSAINLDTDELYVVGPISFVINLETRKVEYLDTNSYRYHYPQVVYLETMNKIQATGVFQERYNDMSQPTNHIEFDGGKRKFFPIGAVNGVRGCSLIHVASMRKLFLFGGDGEDRIWSCNVVEGMPYVWKLCDFKLPMAGLNKSFVNVFETMIVGKIEDECSDKVRIWILDILAPEVGWYECNNRMLPNSWSSMCVAGDWLYIAQNYEDRSEFLRLNIYRLTPRDIHTRYSRRLITLLTKYRKETCESLRDVTWPPYINSLIIDMAYGFNLDKRRYNKWWYMQRPVLRLRLQLQPQLPLRVNQVESKFMPLPLPPVPTLPAPVMPQFMDLSSLQMTPSYQNWYQGQVLQLNALLQQQQLERDLLFQQEQLRQNTQYQIVEQFASPPPQQQQRYQQQQQPPNSETQVTQNQKDEVQLALSKL